MPLLASLLSAVITFGSPEVSFLLFDVYSGILLFLFPPFPFLSLRLLSPAAVPGFWFPFLVILCLFHFRQHLVSAFVFLAFFLVSS